MQEVITWYFAQLLKVWHVITSYWFLSMTVVFWVFKLVIDMIQTTQGKR